MYVPWLMCVHFMCQGIKLSRYLRFFSLKKYSIRTRSRAVNIFNTFAELIGSVKVISVHVSVFMNGPKTFGVSTLKNNLGTC